MGTIFTALIMIAAFSVGVPVREAEKPNPLDGISYTYPAPPALTVTPLPDSAYARNVRTLPSSIVPSRYYKNPSLTAENFAPRG